MRCYVLCCSARSVALARMNLLYSTENWATIMPLVNSPDETAVMLLNEAIPDKEMTPKGVTHAAAGV